jgi:hypothetical protein
LFSSSLLPKLDLLGFHWRGNFESRPAGLDPTPCQLAPVHGRCWSYRHRHRQQEQSLQQRHAFTHYLPAAAANGRFLINYLVLSAREASKAKDYRLTAALVSVRCPYHWGS